MKKPRDISSPERSSGAKLPIVPKPAMMMEMVARTRAKSFPSVSTFSFPFRLAQLEAGQKRAEQRNELIIIDWCWLYLEFAINSSKSQFKVKVARN